MGRRENQFTQDMERIQRTRQRRRAQREQERLLDENTPIWEEKWEDLKDDWEFSTWELKALGREAAKTIAREVGSLAKVALIEGVEFAGDLTVAMMTLGMVDPPFQTEKDRRLRQRHRSRYSS